MNTWPPMSSFSDMLQQPQRAFVDPELKKCELRKYPRNPQPFGIPGQFAVVYEAKLPNGSKAAIRAFKSYRREIRDRYRAISDHLAQHKGRLACLVGFEYVEKGLRATDGNLYPMIRMEWVTGDTLFDWVNKKCIARDRPALARASQRWCQLIQELQTAQIAHGDLQHNNVLVNGQDEFKLVDYDCMCVPALVNEPNLEIGVVPYQHPQRDCDTRLSLALDNFSALFIYVALVALSEQPDLWDRHVLADDYEKLLFRKSDFEAPQRSGLYQTVIKSANSDLVRLTKTLFELYRKNLADVPALQTLLFSYDNIQDLLRQRKFHEVVQELDRKGDYADAPGALQAPIRNAYERVACWRKLAERIDAGDESLIKQTYTPALLDDFPAAQPAVRVAKDAAKAIGVYQQFEAAKKAGQYRRLEEIWRQNEAWLGARRSSAPWRTLVDAWRPRNQLCGNVVGLVQQADCDVAELKRTWELLLQLGGHPESNAVRTQVERLLLRDDAWAKFAAVLQQVQGAGSDRLDEQLRSLWNDDLFRGWKKAEACRPKRDQAERRWSLIQQIESANQRTLSMAGEQEIVRLADGLPPGYQYGLSDRVRTARQRIAAVVRLPRLLAAPTSEEAIVAAGEELRNLGAEVLIPANGQDRIRLAERRLAAWAQFYPALQDSQYLSCLEVDQRIDGGWDDNVFSGWRQAEDVRPQFEQARRRLATVARLQEVLDRYFGLPTLAGENELIDIASALPDGYRYPPREERVQAAQQRIQAREQLLAALRSGEGQQIAEAWSAVQAADAQSLIDRTQQESAILAEQRMAAWSRFQVALQQPDSSTNDADRELWDAWDERLFGGWPQVERERDRVQLAKQHLDVIDELRQLERRFAATPTSAGEKRILEVAGQLPSHYQYPDSLGLRIAAAQQRVVAMDELIRAVQEPALETAIVAAWDQAVRAAAQPLVDSAVRDRVTLAQRRVPAIETLRQIPPGLPVDIRDQQLLQTWQDALLRDCHEASPWQQDFDEAVRRRDLLQQLELALGAKDTLTVARITAEPCLRDYPFPGDWAPTIEEARRQFETVDALLRALSLGDKSAFRRQFDARIFRLYHDKFTTQQNRLLQWTKELILPKQNLDWGLARGQDSVYPLPGARDIHRVRWIFPSPRYSDECLLGVCSSRPSATADPLTLHLRRRVNVTRATLETSGGCPLSPSSSLLGDYVFIWAIIDLGFARLYSEPMELGRIVNRR